MQAHLPRHPVGPEASGLGDDTRLALCLLLPNLGSSAPAYPIKTLSPQPPRRDGGVSPTR